VSASEKQRLIVGGRKAENGWVHFGHHTKATTIVQGCRLERGRGWPVRWKTSKEVA
jgi:hypothetical protein